MSMRNPDLFAVAHGLLSKNAQLRSGEQFCLVTDTERLSLAEIFAGVASTMGSDPVLVVMSPRAQHGEEVPEIVASSMEKADLVFQVVTHAMTHTDATQRALQAGARVLVLRGVTEDLMLHGAIRADYKQIATRCAQLAEQLAEANQARVHTPLGTDLVMSLTGRQPHVLDGTLKGPGTFAAMPDGETAVSPVEGSTEGLLVIEKSMDALGLLDEPIRMRVSGGKVVSIEGGDSARQLERLVKAADDGATNIAEFAVGTNPRARLIGNMAEDKKLEGSVHIAIGDNHVLGGAVKSNIHLDGLLLNPTVELDGRVIVEAGDFKL
ncbi:aminopeptidase [Acidobacteria bacterium AH-259-D05]|nr:aminopeptidase [Acidobacteria bacterium AH-259-D05]